MTRAIRAFLLTALVFLGCGGQADAARRLALLIGIDKYDNLPLDKQLRNAVNDVHTLGDTLRKLDFAVETVLDPDLDRMIDAVNKLVLDASPGDTVLFFFSGHGISPDSVNLLLPRDFPALTAGGPTDRERARRAAYAESDIIAALRTKLSDIKTGQQRGLIIFVSDACRDDPFTRRSQGTRGLAAIPQGVEAKPTEGVFSIYSAGLGQTALDGLSPSDRNSVFMTAFASMLPTPGRHLGDLMAEVKEVVAGRARTRIDEDTGRPHLQVPAVYDETLGGRIFLASRSSETAPPPVVPPAPVTPAPVLPNAQEQTALQRELAGDRRYFDCVRKDDVDCYQSLLDAFPEHSKVEQVRTLIRAKTELPRYQACLGGQTPGERLRLCDLYINAFPRGKYRGDAETLREQAMLDLRPPPQSQPLLQPPPVVPPPSPPVVVAPPAQIPSPSFPCSRARLPSEIAVCGSAVLATLDVTLSHAYGAAARGGASAVKDRQRLWLQSRNACGSNAGCLEASYREQIRWLQAWQAQAAIRPPPAADIRPSFPCGKASLPAEYAVCGSATLALLDVQLAQAYARRRGSAQIRSAQQAWIARRNACGTDVSCLERRYREQIGFLSR